MGHAGLLFHFMHRDIDDTNLISASIIGKPGSGKTTTINDICAGIRQTNPACKSVFLYTKDFKTIREIHKHEYKKDVEDADMVIIFLDDAVTTMHSKDGLGTMAKDNEKFFYLIRHYFNEEFKKKGRTVIVFFATQRYMALANIARGSDILLWKISNIREPQEKKTVISMMGKEGFRLVNSLNKAMSKDYNMEILQNTVFRVMGNTARWLKIPERGTVDWVHLKKLPKDEEIKFTKDQKIMIIQRALIEKLNQRTARFLAGCSIELVQKVYNEE